MSSDGCSRMQGVSRRGFLAAGAGAFLLPLDSAAGSSQRGGIVVLDYGLATTLMALGTTPAGIASLADWDKWVIEPAVPPGVVDVGASFEVNMEVIATLQPGLILSVPFLSALKPKLETLAPVEEFSVYRNGENVLRLASEETLRLGELVGQAGRAAEFVADTEAFFDECAVRVRQLSPPPLAITAFLDERHVRLYGGSGLFQSVMDRIGLKNAWQGNANLWGFAAMGVEELGYLDPDLRLMIIEPLRPAGILRQLGSSPLWTGLPFVRGGRISVVPGILLFGMLVEAKRFARIILSELERVTR